MNKLLARVLFAVLLISTCSACGEIMPGVLSSKEVDGTVFNPDTGEPIEGAIVLLTWTGMQDFSIFDGFDGHSSPNDLCYHVETAITDTKGHYHINAWKQKREYDLSNGLFRVYAYKRGLSQSKDAGSGGEYWRSDTGLSEDYVQSVKKFSPNVEMRSFTGSLEERLTDLKKIPVLCGYSGKSVKNLKPILNAMIDELKEHPEISALRSRSETLQEYLNDIR